MAFKITDGSRDERKPLEAMTTALHGKVFTRHRSPIHALVPILSCLAAYPLAQAKVNIGTITIPNTMHTIPSSS